MINSSPTWQILSPDGDTPENWTPQLSDSSLLELFRLMHLTRRVDVECVNLHRQGILAAYPSLTGQEGAQVGSASALTGAHDFIFPSYREQGAAIARGVDLLAFMMFHRTTWNGGLYDPRAHNFAMICSSVGSHLLHAVGWAMGMRKHGTNAVALAYFGDGATSEGDAHEAFNLAAVFSAPVVFFCQNNQFAISTPYDHQSLVPVFRKALAYGFPGIQVDGHDVLAVYEATRWAAQHASDGGGPALIEALTYRVGPHNTADDPGRYRDAAVADSYSKLDPLLRYRRFLERTGRGDSGFFNTVDEAADRFITELRRGIIETPDRPFVEVFDYTFTKSFDDLLQQRASALDLLTLTGEAGPNA